MAGLTAVPFWRRLLAALETEGEDDAMIELHCRRCGAPFTPSKADLLRGPAWYRLCPACRPPAPEAAS